ncbi:porin [Altibacter sp. HG106]|uniref:porin n=1 Tax=Altibacter sp. HG106 TaxID=3023937 RepID=UPI0023502C79|nr:porin [Altibacter sp. HG106]MDC7994769.1 porin [Altibacter sp. HG106]
MRIRIWAISIVALFASVMHAQDTTNTKFGKGLINFVAADSSWSVKFAPRIQFRANSSWDYEGEQYGSPEYTFSIRRARLKFDGFAFSPNLKYKIELGLSNRDVAGANQFNRNTPRIILDAVVKWNFYENFELWVGQTKLPGNVERVVSSANMQLIDRSLLNSNFNIDRDIGFQLQHHIALSNSFLIREKIALSQGEGRNITEGNLGGLQYTGRLEILPFGSFQGKGDYIQADLAREETPKLMLGFTYDHNDDAVKTRSNLGTYMFLEDGSLYETDITTLFADAMFKWQGVSIMAEYAQRQAENPVAVELDGTPTGDIVLVGDAINAQIGYLFRSNYESVFRYTQNTFDAITMRSDIKEYTLGGSKYFVGHKLKIQADLSYRTVASIEDNIRFRMGFELHF